MKVLFARLRRSRRTYRRVVAAVLAGAAVWAGLTALRPESPATVAVLVAAGPLTGGVVIEPGEVSVLQLPSAAVPAQYLTDPAQAVGKPATLPVPQGAVLLPASVVSREALAAPGMAVLPVTLVNTAAGLIEVGDRLDLIGSEQHGAAPVASGARVVAVLSTRQGESSFSPVSSDGPVVLVELRPDALAKVAAAAASGPLGFGFR